MSEEGRYLFWSFVFVCVVIIGFIYFNKSVAFYSVVAANVINALYGWSLMKLFKQLKNQLINR